MASVSVPKGTRDFLPIEMARRNYIFETIKRRFKLFGYASIETPAMENLTTLTGKYGDEGDKLIFKILNSGDYLKEANAKALENKNSSELVAAIAEKALRYDLTVPFARFVVQHQNEINFPFKRYQIQPVWRADRPQKGRYREFYQCDADVVGSESLLYEIELIQLFDQVFADLGIKVTIKINNRKLLVALAQYIGETEKMIRLTIAIDKLDKIPLEKVAEELLADGFSAASIEKLKGILEIKTKMGDLGKEVNDKIISVIKEKLTQTDEGKKGVEELEFILNTINQLELKHANLLFDISLARGLNYYTGAIFEVVADDAEMGSICGGGRYDNLTGIFGLKGVSGVGISFGADRIYDVLNELNLFPKEFLDSTKLLFTNFGTQEELFCLQALQQARSAGISSEIYPDNTAKIKKQLKYANDKSINYVAMVGEDELKTNTITLKNMSSGEQNSVTLAQLIEKLQ
jgi:histidyl-tRNA synthetase